jgi:hypothetical protein
MFDYKSINKKLNKLQNEYDLNVSQFKKFSPIGNINYLSTKELYLKFCYLFIKNK